MRVQALTHCVGRINLNNVSTVEWADWIDHIHFIVNGCVITVIRMLPKRFAKSILTWKSAIQLNSIGYVVIVL